MVIIESQLKKKTKNTLYMFAYKLSLKGDTSTCWTEVNSETLNYVWLLTFSTCFQYFLQWACDTFLFMWCLQIMVGLDIELLAELIIITEIFNSLQLLFLTGHFKICNGSWDKNPQPNKLDIMVTIPHAIRRFTPQPRDWNLESEVRWGMECKLPSLQPRGSNPGQPNLTLVPWEDQARRLGGR